MMPSSVYAWHFIPENPASTGTDADRRPFWQESLLLSAEESAELESRATGAPSSLVLLKDAELSQLQEVASAPQEASSLAKTAAGLTATMLAAAEETYTPSEPDVAANRERFARNAHVELPWVDLDAIRDRRDAYVKEQTKRRTQIAQSYVVTRPGSPGVTNAVVQRAAGEEGEGEVLTAEEVLDDPDALLAVGDRHKAEGRDSEAALVYFQLQDRHPNTESAKFAEQSIIDLALRAERGEVATEQLYAFMENVPTVDEMQTGIGKYWVTLAQRVAGHVARSHGSEAVAQDWYRESRTACRELMDEYANEGIALQFVHGFMESSRLLGVKDTQKAVQELNDIIADTRVHDARRFASLGQLVAHHKMHAFDRVEALIVANDLADEYQKGYFDKLIQSDVKDTRLRAHLLFNAGFVHFQITEREEALKTFEGIIKNYPDAGAVVDWARYYRALCAYYLSDDDPFVGVEALEAAIAEKPDSTYADTALWTLGRLYLKTENYVEAESVFAELVEYFPHSKWQNYAQRGLEQARRSLEEQGASGAPQVRADNKPDCGVHALASMLNVSQDVVRAQLVLGNDGASMAALQDAAAQLDVSLAGQLVTGLEDVSIPFIAFVNNGHFVSVHDYDETKVRLVDNGQPKIVSRKAFEAGWNGECLVRQPEGEATLLALSTEMMNGIIGGLGDGYGDGGDTYSSDINQNVDCANGWKECCDGTKVKEGNCCKEDRECDNGGGGNSNPYEDLFDGVQCFAPPCDGSNGMPDRPSGPSCPTNCGPGGPPPGGPPPPPPSGPGGPISLNPNGSFPVSTGAPGTGIIVSPKQSSQNVGQTDISFPVQGSMNISFKRSWHNPFGYNRAYFDSTAGRPYGGALGHGWTHNYNTHLRISSAGGYIVHMDAAGNAMEYKESATSGVYTKNTGVVAPGRQTTTITKNVDDTYTMAKPSGISYDFSDALDATTRYCRLEAISDLGGNEIDLQYTDSDTYSMPYGKLTRINAPGSDNRYLKFDNEFSTGLLTKVSLYADTTEVRSVEYIQDGAYDLTGVEVNGGNPVKYEYTTVTSGTHTGKYISKVTDRANVSTHFDFDYDYSATLEYYQPTKIRVRYDNDLHTVVSKIGWPTDYNMARVENYDGTTYNAGTDTYSAGPLTRWDGDVEPGTESTGVGYFRIYTDPANSSNYHEWTYDYDSAGNLTTITDPDNSVFSRFEYTSAGRLSKARNGGDVYDVEYHYENSGDNYPTRMTHQNGVETYWFYDSLGRLTRRADTATSQNDPPSSTTDGSSFEWDNNNQVTKYTTIDGAEWLYQYDDRGNRVTVIHPGDNQTTPTHPTTYEYNDYGRVTKATDQFGNYKLFEYEDEGCTSCGGGAGLRLVKVTDEDGNETEYEYDANGNMVTMTDALNRITVYSYDTMNRVTSVTSNEGRVSTTAYDILGHVTKSTSPTGEEHTYTYDFMGRVATMTDAEGSTSYAFDKRGRMTQVTDGNGHSTTYNYHATTQRLFRVDDATGKVMKYFVDDYRRVTRVGSAPDSSSAVDDSVDYAYNGDGQLTTVTYINGTNTKSVGYTYHNGRVTQVSDWFEGGTAVQYFQYDTLGRAITHRDFDDDPSGTRQVLEYVYDYEDRVATMEHYDGYHTIYTYTDRGQLSTISAPGSAVWDYDYNVLGQVTQYSHPNGMNTVYEYDGDNRLTKIEHNDGATPTPTILAGWEYGLNDDGNIVRMASLTSDQRWDYGYDGRSRLTDAIYLDDSGLPEFRMAYAYDAGDNMLTKEKVSYETVLEDDFSDNDYTNDPSWTVGSGAWTAANGYLEDDSDLESRIYIGQTDTDVDLWFSYYAEDATPGSMVVRLPFDDWDNRVNVTFSPTNTAIYERTGGAWTTPNPLVSNGDADTVANTWYDVYIHWDGTHMEVWRAEQGEALERILETDALSTTASTQMQFQVPAGKSFRFDDVRLVKASSSAASLSEDFSSGHAAWGTSGTWSSAGGDLQNTVDASSWRSAWQGTSYENGTIDFTYTLRSGTGVKADPRLIFRPRTTEWNNSMFIYFYKNSASLMERVNGTWYTRDTDAGVDSTLDQAYDVRVVMNGANVEVWRGETGETMALVLSTSIAVNRTANALTFTADSESLVTIDDVALTTQDPETVTFAYNDANELTTMTADGTPTYFAYDSAGRTISKWQNASIHAEYTWRFGDKLKRYDSTFPGEQDVAYNYDGLGKRRLRVVDPDSTYDADNWTWYRWVLGWNELSEHTDDGTGTWGIGARTVAFVSDYGGVLAHADGTALATGDYVAYAKDHLGSPRALFDDSFDQVATYDFMPYGSTAQASGMAMNVGFTGHTWDASGQKYYAPYRYLSTQTGRWASRDPLGMVDGTNLYLYLWGRPGAGIDPLGLFGGPYLPPDGYEPHPPFNPQNFLPCLNRALEIAQYAEGATHSIRHCVAVCEAKKCGLPGWIGSIVNAIPDLLPWTSSDDWRDDIIAGNDAIVCIDGDCLRQCKTMGW